MRRGVLPVLDARGVIVAWKDAPRRILVRPPTVIMVTHAPAGRDALEAFTPGMLLRVAEAGPDGVLFEVLHEGER